MSLKPTTRALIARGHENNRTFKGARARKAAATGYKLARKSLGGAVQRSNLMKRFMG